MEKWRHTFLFGIFLHGLRSDCFAEPLENPVPCPGWRAWSSLTWEVLFLQLVKVAVVTPLWLRRSPNLGCSYQDFRLPGKACVIYKGRGCSIIDLNFGRAPRTFSSTLYTYFRPAAPSPALSAWPVRSLAPCLHQAQFWVGFPKFWLVILVPLVPRRFRPCFLED